MAATPTKPGKPPTPPPARLAREAEALRENLRKRKLQSRARQAAPHAKPAEKP